MDRVTDLYLGTSSFVRFRNPASFCCVLCMNFIKQTRNGEAIPNHLRVPSLKLLK